MASVDLLKPPNWTARKQSLMQKHQQKETPNLTANIDYILDELAREMQASREKDRHSLLMQKMKDNPNNARFLKSKRRQSE